MPCAIGAEALSVPPCQRLKKFAPFRSGKVRCVTVRASRAPSVDEQVSRRQALQGLAVLAASALVPPHALAAGKSAEVGRHVLALADQVQINCCNLTSQLSAAICHLLGPLAFQTFNQTSRKLQ